MKTIVPFPSIDFMNHYTHDFKGHYRYARGYQDLVMDTFQKLMLMELISLLTLLKMMNTNRQGVYFVLLVLYNHYFSLIMR